jgi:hypothetical protein
MGTTIYPTVPVEGQGAQPAAEPWPAEDEFSVRTDEMFARQLDNEFSAGVRSLLHDPETGVAAQSGEAALHAVAGAMPALSDLKEQTLAQAVGPRQRAILEPLIDTRLDWAAGTLGRLAQRATVEVDDASVAERIAGLNQDAAAAWQDTAHLRKLGRSAVEELRYQGERRGWNPAETDARVRSGLSDLYAGAVETAIGQDALEGASGLYDHAREVIDPDRQAELDRRFVQAREVAVYRDVDRDMAGIPLDPAGPPGVEVFEKRAAELTPEDASDDVRAGIAQVAAFAQRRAERQWQKQQTEAGVAALDWLGKNPGASMLAIPSEIRSSNSLTTRWSTSPVPSLAPISTDIVCRSTTRTMRASPARRKQSAMAPRTRRSSSTDAPVSTLTAPWTRRASTLPVKRRALHGPTCVTGLAASKRSRAGRQMATTSTAS